MNPTNAGQPTEDPGLLSPGEQHLAATVGAGLRERKKQQMREALSHAALHLAIERGPENVRIEDVTTTVGVSYRTFANYFGSREEAIVAVAVDRTARIVDLFRDRPPTESLAEALIQAFIHPYQDPDPSPASHSNSNATSDPGSGPASASASSTDAPDREDTWLPRVREVLAAPTLIGAYLAARLTSEHALAEAIAERTHTDAARDLYPRVLASAVLGAEHAAVRFWLDSGSSARSESAPAPASASALIRQAIEQVVLGGEPAATARDTSDHLIPERLPS
ncbi:MAG TPA: TetR/AcrR family transcriptional regulator [Actinocrinis sp.]|nr:TetR/AcrR family transcriptional regulator [Actinocrinis sp.]